MHSHQTMVWLAGAAAFTIPGLVFYSIWLGRQLKEEKKKNHQLAERNEQLEAQGRRTDGSAP
jgi:hypothetical protein